MVWAKLRVKVQNFISESRFGLIIIGIIIAFRLSGSLQLLELLTLDKFQQIKIRDSPDTLITLVGIDERYLSNKSNASLEYADLTAILERILSHQPAIVGVDIVKDDLSGEGKQRLIQLLNSNERLLTIETIRTSKVAPLEGLLEDTINQRVGFNDFSLDAGGNVRRMFLGWTPKNSQFRESLALMLARRYLEDVKNIEIFNGIRDKKAMRFGTVEIPRLTAFSGAYQNETLIYGIQTLVNFRSSLHLSRKKELPFNILLTSELRQSDFKDQDIRGKIIIVGSIDPKSAIKFDSAMPSQLVFNKDRLTGLELQAHATSQITSAVIEGRPLLHALHSFWEYALIIAFGFLGIVVKRVHKSALRSFVYLSAVSLFLIFISYCTLNARGLLLPTVPILMAFTTNGFTYTVVAQSEKRWQALVKERDLALEAVRLERKRTIEHAFDTIHNGPLQTLANLLRLIRDDQIDSYNTGLELEKLNQEIREIGESLRQEAIGDQQLYIQVGKAKLAINTPMHELFYEIYRETLQRSFPGFETLKVQVRSFEPVRPENIPDECKRKLCRYFEETLCNVGRHANGATKLIVTGETKKQFYHLKVIDNGAGFRRRKLPKPQKGRGTKIAHEIEAGLKGKFTRRSHYPKGVSCEFKWPLS